MNRRCQRRCLASVKAGRSTKERGREEEEEEEDCKERQVKNEIAQEVVATIKKKAGAPEDAKPTSQRTVGQKLRQYWDCSKIEDRDEEE